jgi:ABC-type multidrug transport system fused ATPase/permease subunit
LIYSFAFYMRALKSVNKYLWRYRWLLLTGILFVGLANVFQVYAPRYIGEMIDLVTVNFDAVVKQNDTKLADEVYRGVAHQWPIISRFYHFKRHFHVFYAANHYCDEPQY